MNGASASSAALGQRTEVVVHALRILRWPRPHRAGRLSARCESSPQTGTIGSSAQAIRSPPPAPRRRRSAHGRRRTSRASPGAPASPATQRRLPSARPPRRLPRSRIGQVLDGAVRPLEPRSTSRVSGARTRRSARDRPQPIRRRRRPASSGRSRTATHPDISPRRPAGSRSTGTKHQAASSRVGSTASGSHTTATGSSTGAMRISCAKVESSAYSESTQPSADARRHLAVRALEIDRRPFEAVLDVADHAGLDVGGCGVAAVVHRHHLDAGPHLAHVARDLAHELRDAVGDGTAGPCAWRAHPRPTARPPRNSRSWWAASADLCRSFCHPRS